jgi:hypothetical protein
MGGIIEARGERGYILGGRAVFTVKSLRTGDHLTYRVNETEKGSGRYFVSAKVGDLFLYVGILKSWHGVYDLYTTAKSRVGKESLAVRTFEFILGRYINSYRPHSEISIYHRGVCSRCGRRLTDPESIAWGMGKVCRFYNC